MANTARQEFAARLDAARRRAHLSLSDVAKIAGVGKTTAHDWLNGEHFPTPALRPAFVRLVAALGLEDEIPDELWSSPSERDRDGRAPYLGLRSFGVADRAFFHGRGEQLRLLAAAIERLREGAGQGLLALLGPSGSGKSSLLAAGLLGTECADGTFADWSVRTLSPDDLVTSEPDGDLDLVDLVVIDQFEAVLRLDPELVAEGMARLARLSASSVVLIALRSDAFGEAVAHPQLYDALSRPVLIAPLTRDELDEVITAPAALMGVSVAPDLVRTMVNELAPAAGSVVPLGVLPLLSTALLLTWQRGSGASMTVEDYVAGGVARALDSQAEGAFATLDAAGQRDLPSVLLRMTRISGTDFYTRPLLVGRLDAGSRALLQPFVEARLLVVDDASIRFSHDSLLDHWVRLHGWLAERQAELRDVERLSSAAALWHEAGEVPELLLPVERLGSVGALAGDASGSTLLSAVERDYLAASRAHFGQLAAKERRTTSMLRRRSRLAFTLVALTSALALVAADLYVRSEGFRTEAVSAQLNAESRQVAIASRSVADQDANTAAQLALVGHSLADTLEARSALLDAASKDVPTRWLGSPSAVLAADPVGGVVVRADGAGHVTLWQGDEIATGQGRQLDVDAGGQSLMAVAVERWNGHELLAAGGPEVAKLWDVTDPGSPVQLADYGRSGVTAYALGFGPDGGLAVGGSDGLVQLVGVDGGGRPTGVDAQVQITPAGASDPVAVGALTVDAADRLSVGGVPDVIKQWQLGATAPVALPDVAFHLGSSPLKAVSVAISPDGTRMAAATTAGVVRWRADGDTLVAQPALTSFKSWVNSVSWSPDGQRLVVGSSDQTVQVFDADATDPARTLTTPALVTGAVQFGSHLVAVGSDGTVRVWSADDPELRGEGAAVYDLSGDATGSRWLAGGTLAQGALLWRLDGSRPVQVPLPYPTLTGARSAAVAIAPNAAFVVAASKTGEIVSWPLTSDGPQAPRVIDSGIGYISCLTISPDSGLVAAMGFGGTKVAILRAGADGSLTPLSEVDAEDAQAGAFSADSNVLSVAIASNEVLLWTGVHGSSPVLASTITGFATATIWVTTAPRSQQLAVGEDSGEVSVWSFDDPAHPRKTHDLTDAHGSAYTVNFSPDESLLAMASGDQKVWVWNLGDHGRAEYALSGDLDRPWDVRFAYGGTVLVASGNNGRIRTWPVTTQEARTSLCALRGDQLTDREWAQNLPGIARTDPCR